MANENKPFGLRPVKSLLGAPVNLQMSKFYVPATDSTAIYVGDPVKLSGSQGILYQGDAPVPIVEKAAAGNSVVGVMVGFEPVYGSLDKRYREASVGMYVYVVTDPNTVFEVQGDADSFAAADVGGHMTLTVSSGNATTGVSNAVADQSSAATTTSLDMQILGTTPSPDNDLTGGYPLLLVRLNNHAYINNDADTVYTPG